MEETFAARNVITEFVEVADDTVYVGYQSHRTDSVQLFTELRVVVATVLEHEPGTEVVGAVFHTEHPIVGVWRVDEAWADSHRAGDLSDTAVTARVLHTFRTVEV